MSSPILLYTCLPGLVAALCTASAATPATSQFTTPSKGGLVTLDAAFGLGAALGFAVSSSVDAGAKAWLGEGTTITVFDDVFNTSPGTSIVDTIPIEALPLNLLPDEASSDERLFVAGGPAGLIKLEKVAGEWVQTLLDHGRAGVCNYPGDRWCTDVGLIRIDGIVYLVASYAAKGDATASCNSLRLYDLDAARAAAGTLVPALDEPLLTGPAPSSWPLAWRFAVQQGRNEVYVALGTAGLVRVGLSDSLPGPGVDLSATVSAPFVIPLASLPYADDLMLDADPPFPDVQARFLDVAVTDEAVYAAADAAGLVQIPFGTFPPTSWERYSPGLSSNDELGTYAVNVAAVEQSGTSARVAVSGNKRPAQRANGQPFAPWGTMSARGNVGGEFSFPASHPDWKAIVLYRESAPNVLVAQPDAFPDAPKVAYGLELRALGANDYLTYTDTLVRYRTQSPGPDERFQFKGRRGNVTTDGTPLLHDPNVMIFGQDAGAEFRGALAFDPVAHEITAVPNTRFTEDDAASDACVNPCGVSDDPKLPRVFIGGIWAGAQWPDVHPDFQWMVQGQGEHFEPCSGSPGPCDWEEKTGAMYEISRFDPNAVDGGTWGLDWWQMLVPVDQDNTVGGSYFGAHHDPVSDLVFFVRGVSRWGLMVSPRSIVESGRTSALPNGDFLPAPTQIKTHFDDFNPGFPGPATFNARAFDWNPGGGGSSERVLAVTTGFSGPGATPGFGHAKLTFFRMSSILAGDPDPEKVLAFGPADSNAAAVALADLDPVGGVGGSDPRTFAFVSDHGGRLLVYDLEHLFDSPEIAQASAVYQIPISKLDGRRENLMDLELVWRGDKLFAYLSTWRRGLTIVDVTDPLSPQEVNRSPIRFPGMCQGLSLRRDPSVSAPIATDTDGVPVTHLIVTDHFTSTRIYRW